MHPAWLKAWNLASERDLLRLWKEATCCSIEVIWLAASLQGMALSWSTAVTRSTNKLQKPVRGRDQPWWVQGPHGVQA